jgi:hypothetical protein
VRFPRMHRKHSQRLVFRQHNLLLARQLRCVPRKQLALTCSRQRCLAVCSLQACQVQRMSDIAQRNIRQNLSPQATAAAVGSGQYGSQRGAQVLGQITAQAEQCLNANIANLLSQGYGQALTAAQQRQALLGQLGQTAGALGQQQASLLGQLGQTAGGLTSQQMQNLITAGSTLGQQQTAANQIAAGLGATASQAQAAQNQAQLQAAQTAAQSAAQQAGALQAAGLGMGTLGQTAQGMNLADINALATLGAQQQQIAQNQQLFPLQKLSSLSSLLQGYQVPTTVKTTMCMSPFSAVGAAGAGLMGMLTPTTAGGKSPLCSIICTFKKYYPSTGSGLSYNPGSGYGSGTTSTGLNIFDTRNYPDYCGNLGP